MSRAGLLIVMTGPSGAGKSTLVQRVQQQLPEVRFSVSCTTRPPRQGEREGIDYFFVDVPEFEARLARGEFLEHATVHGNLYGTLRSHVLEEVASGAVILLDIDVQGAAQVRASGVDATFVFILPPSFEVLATRLRNRGTDEPEVIERRLAVARSEMAEADWFDHRVVNDDLQTAAGEFVEILEQCRESAAEGP